LFTVCFRNLRRRMVRSARCSLTLVDEA
jgi:hypothetical protein